ncbi:MAG TPA: hypothetical protein VN922_01115, partial [Bacteroidia bacterium]|nr:hypothetical protein [Bacteroidia bacterium]
MLSKKLPLVSFILLFAGAYNANAQNVNKSSGKEHDEPKTSWKVDPYDSKIFIRNEGQADDKLPEGSEKVLFQAKLGEVAAYFTGKGVVYRYDEYPKRDKEEEEKESASDRVKNSTPKSYYLTAEWEGSNPGVMITADQEQTYYYSFGMGLDRSIKANVFKKITYHNLYPGIDVEYFFPNGKSGIKYTVIVHPGADISKMKLNYKGAKSLNVDVNGDVIVKTTKMGDITDHAPVSYYEGEQNKIGTKYTINGTEESFSANELLDGTKTMVIDPWTTDPTFSSTSSSDKALDIDYDNQGNVYAYGGGGGGGLSPYQLVKINSAGTVLWVFVNAGGISSQIYGDFAVDKATGTSYIVGPPGGAAGSVVEKVNTLGNMTGS